MLAPKKRGIPSQLLAGLLVTALSLPAVVPVAYAQGNSQTQANKQSQAQLEALVAPIALYPDPLVSQILMASTYPLEVSEATNWLRANSNLKGNALNTALQQQNWDASVKSLVSFPPVLEMMGSQLSWTQNLGNAVLAQQSDTMSAIQALRAKAKKTGALQSNSQQTVTSQGSGSSETIVIQPANPQVVYVPSYNPTVVYGAWPYPAYPPVAYYPPGYVAGTALLSFGVGMAVGAALWGGCHWGGGYGGGSLTVNNNNFNNFNRNTNSNWSGNKNGTSDWKPDQQRRNANVGGGSANRDAERDQLRQNLQKNGISSDDRGNLGNRDGDRNLGQNDRSGDRNLGDRNSGARDNSPSNFRNDSSGFGDARGAKFNSGGDRFGGGGARAGGEHFGGGGFRGRR
ncbi:MULTISPECIES: DUF3300 domain-containing protein [unclassified Polynucleobacter]|uniref:DUF3300 domain-containing protein n=1 Tax=unclassified Polynucleobacter TaxID=2640945 RepID=UPI001BFDACA2|nr:MULTISPECIES: DUF3300 domain-containing protein [unclassified Polynucleobacter]MCX7237188.1 DUF3300 domain-containing protein [Polynucleobacter sp.]QWD65555.1 DUF3300 domain-containing protein [Polynucleobacter sp. MWH-Aus1W21]